MRLIKCHAENFGKLSSFEYDFSKGLNVIKEPNGWGKTTFANFLKAMFYGLEKTRVQSLDENARKKYIPWKGGNYGGYVDFEVNGKTYRIERYFADKESDDTFNLYDLSTNKLSTDYSENIGEELFGLDAEAFERTAFIPQKSLDTGVKGNIENRLNALLHGADENFDFEDAIARLKERKKRLSNTHGTGVIDKITEKITQTELEVRGHKAQLSGASQLKAELDERDLKIKALAEEKAVLDESVKRYGELKEKQLKQEAVKKLGREIETINGEITELREFFNNVDLTYKEIDVARFNYDNAQKKHHEVFYKTENNYAEAQYEKLRLYFKDGVPSKEQFVTVSDKISKLNELKRDRIKDEVTLPEKQKLLLPIIFGAVGLSLIIAGALTTIILALSIVLFALGFISLCGAVVIFLLGRKNYKTLTEKSVLYREQEEKIKALKQEINAFISIYEKGAVDYQTVLGKIMGKVEEYEKLKVTHEQFEAEIREINKEKHAYKEKCEAFLAQYKLPPNLSIPEKLDYLKQKRYDLAGKCVERDEKIKTLNELKAELSSEGESEEIAIDILDIQQKQRKLQNDVEEYERQKATIKQKIRHLEEEAGKINELEGELENLNGERDEYKEQLKHVSNAIKFLEKANESLRAKFLKPMKSQLVKYYGALTGSDANNLYLDTDFSIAFEEYGKQRESGYYSKGYKTAIALSMRFALIATLFEGEKPYIVLDDPFVDLDGDKLQSALSCLKELEKEYQIIYFTCHDSRAN